MGQRHTYMQSSSSNRRLHCFKEKLLLGISEKAPSHLSHISTIIWDSPLRFPLDFYLYLGSRQDVRTAGCSTLCQLQITWAELQYSETWWVLKAKLSPPQNTSTKGGVVPAHIASTDLKEADKAWRRRQMLLAAGRRVQQEPRALFLSGLHYLSATYMLLTADSARCTQVLLPLNTLSSCILELVLFFCFLF